MDRLFSEAPGAFLFACDFTDLKNVRLVCKALADAVAPLLFQHVHMGLFPSGLSRLESIANHPVLSKYVKSFTFHGDLLPFYAGGLQEWERKIDLRPPLAEFIVNRVTETGTSSDIDSFRREYENLPKHNKTEAELEHHYKLYEQYRQEQLQWENEREGHRARDAFCKLPNLCEAVVVQSHRDASGKRAPVWKSLLPLILQSPENWTLRNIAYQVEQNRRRIQSVAHLTCLLEALAARAPVYTDCPVTSLASITNGDCFWRQLHRPGAAEQNAMTPTVSHWLQSMEPAFIFLRRIDFRCRFFETENPPIIAAGLVQLLKQAVDLEELSLEFLEENLKGVKDDEVLCDILHYLSPISWPKLRKLALHLVTTEQSLLAFLMRHAASIRELRLIDSVFKKKTGTWISLLRQLPGHLSLEKVVLQDLQDDSLDEDADNLFDDAHSSGEYEQAIKSFVLRQGDFPEGGESREAYYAARGRGYEASAEPDSTSDSNGDSTDQDGPEVHLES